LQRKDSDANLSLVREKLNGNENPKEKTFLEFRQPSSNSQSPAD
jgi:hypothetical protein